MYGRKYPLFSIRCTATARPESLHATTVAAGWPSAISLARFGPEITATCDGSTPVTETMTWLIRIRVPSSMPLARLTSVAPVANKPVHCSRLARIVWAGTASSTVVAPSSASARRRWRGRPAAATRRQVGGVVPGGIDLAATSDRRAHSVTFFRAARPRRAPWPAPCPRHRRPSPRCRTDVPTIHHPRPC